MSESPKRRRTKNQNKIQGDENEKLAAKTTGLKPVRGSGCGIQKGDLASAFIHVEAKSTRAASSPLPNAWFAKATAQAKKKIPIVQFAFAYRRGAIIDQRWVFVRRQDLIDSKLTKPSKLRIILGIDAKDFDVWDGVGSELVRTNKPTVAVLRDGVMWVALPEWWLSKARIESLERLIKNDHVHR